MYEISLKLIINETEALVETKSIMTSYMQRIGTVFRRNPIEVLVQALSTSSISVSWTVPQDLEALQFVVFYKELKTNSWSEALPENK